MRVWLMTTAVALVGAALGPSCTYAPDFKNGALLCGSDESCPKGYRCVAGHQCWKNGVTPTSDGGDNSDGGGTGGAAGTVVDRNALVGTWNFDSGMLKISCTDGTGQTKTLMGPTDHINVAVGSAANTIVAEFYCPWTENLAITSGNAMATIQSGQTCMSTGGCSDFTWMGKTFNFDSADGMNATVDGSIDATYKDYTDTVATMTAGKPVCLPKATTTPMTGSCTLTVSGPLSKM